MATHWRRRVLLRSPELTGLRILALDGVRCDWVGVTDAASLVVHGAGRAAIRIGGELVRAEPGSITCLQPGEPYQVKRFGESDDLVFHIDRTALGIHAAQSSWNRHAPQVRDALRALHHVVRRGEPVLSIDEAIARVVRGLAVVEHVRAPRERIDPPAVARARAVIHERLGESITLADLTAAAGSSRASLLRAFQRRLGLTPHQYLTSLRVARAERLLERGVSIAEVASRVGFCDQSHLHRYFVRLRGTTPGRFVRVTSG